MRATSADPVDRSRFPVDEWALSEVRYDSDGLGQRETVFTVANGYLGLRGNDEEGDSEAFAHGTFVNGFHETWQIHHAEHAFGFARTGQTIVNVPDAKTIALSVDGQPLSLAGAELESFHRWIDFREGVLHRELVWHTASGRRVTLRTSRMVSFSRRNLAVMTFEVTVDGAADVVIASELRNRQDEEPDGEARVVGVDPRRSARFEHRVLLPQLAREEQGRMAFGYRTARSGLGLAVYADHELVTSDPVTVETRITADLGRRTYRVTASAGSPIRLVKWVAYHDGPPETQAEDLVARARLTLEEARSVGRDVLAAEQRDWLAAYWSGADVQIEGRPELQQAVRWCLFQLAQATGRADGRGIAAKGVTGSGYEGHYFWDTEVYLVPFLAHTSPELALGTLRFRISMLGAARERARELSQRGALFPWRTINGEEASAYFPAGTAQYHIDADVAWALCKYADVCGDPDFLTGEALPVLVETARLWADLGFLRPGTHGPSFHLHSVTGPDEYTAMVNDNLYTNVMARANLRRAAAAVRSLAATDPERFAATCVALSLDPGEVDAWESAADAMTVPYDEQLGVHAQDAAFLSREVWDLAATPAEQIPLLLHYHPLVIYRFQVLKQADVVLALFLAGGEFTRAQKRADFEYYDPITTGDSTLSAVVQSIIAAEVGYQARALSLFMEGVFVDLADLHHNTGDGVHIASAGGVWSAIVNGFGGLRDDGGRIRLDPRLPADWTRLRFTFRLEGSRVRAELSARELVLTLLDGPGGSVEVRGSRVALSGPDPVRVPLEDQGPLLATLPGRIPLVHGRPATTEQVSVGLPDSRREVVEYVAAV